MTVASVLSRGARSHVALARCEEFAASLPDGSVNLLWLDPPYFRVVDEAWDRAWKTEAAYLEWLRGVVCEACRVLARNGSLYLFASSQMAARAEVIASEYSRIVNSIVWAKPHGTHSRHSPDNCRGWRTKTERVVFAERRSVAVSAVGDAIRAARGRAGMSSAALDLALGFRRSADVERGTGIVRQWETDDPGSCVPSAADFARALRACGDDRPEEVLAAEYEVLARPFAAPEAFTDVWEYAPVVSGDAARHPCEKPVDMLRDVVLASSRPGDVVCEFFGGSFRMAEVALAHGRRYLGCDANPHWAAVGVERARAAESGALAMVPARPGKAKADAPQLSLFAGAAS